MLEEQRELFKRLANIDLDALSIVEELTDRPEQAATVTQGSMIIFLPLAGLVDLDAERARLQKELDNVEKMIARANGLLGNENFVGKAKPEVVQRERDKLAELESTKTSLEERIGSL